MSDYDYNALLTPGIWRGKCGQKELLENINIVEEKVKKLAKWIAKSNHFVVFTGAGISTSAGISDFRGPKGVWTLEEKEKKQKTKNNKKKENKSSFHDALPTKTHMALVSLQKKSILKCIISQNVDGLHMVSGIPRDKLSELHGNIFMICCSKCGKEDLSDVPIQSVGFKELELKCKYCNENMRDCTLDWNDNLPEYDLNLAKNHIKKSDLCLCLGSSLQVTPAANLPVKVTKNSVNNVFGKFVIVNLQKTPKDNNADLIIRYYVDDVMSMLLKYLNMQVLEPIRLPMKDLKSIFCKTKPKNWLETQLNFDDEEDEESEETEDDNEDISSNISEIDPEWQPNTKKPLLPQKRTFLCRVSPRTIKKLCT